MRPTFPMFKMATLIRGLCGYGVGIGKDYRKSGRRSAI